MFIYVNGDIIHREEARISPYDHGYLYGLGLFETFAVVDGHPFLLDDHFQRLQRGLAVLDIQWTYSREAVLTILQSLLKKNGLTNAYVRWNISAGIEDIGLYTGKYSQPSVIVFVKPLPNRPLEKKAEFLQLRRNTPEGSERLKSHHYLNNLLAKRELGSSGDKEGIFLTEEGFVAEGIVSNVFWVRDRIVYTPDLATGILSGITRQFVLKQLNHWGVRYEEGFFLPSDVKEADEVFMTNSIQEIVPLYFDGQRKGDRFITTQLQGSFEKNRRRLWSSDELK
ncbi:aminodeoxychorismate lyase [Halalkalibacter sp. APA_J-10(15)]|uniref:aminodeoxychorismate lyase n=1 Tax=Halalkalibacter sp. APA_J-10(15) TaxID=2933805 RepID=UPI001FF13E2C|nr:aminodeoxychorismate lyase [Halalkalibacter sp. APA_J-10(15)]MCK0473651.1 aminodeoxychorismate lyase [Halalkalibacter sp. APA_J-10(15)]